MKKTLATVLVALLLAVPAHAQNVGLDDVSKRASDLEAQVNQVLDTSPEAAKAMIELVDLYHEHGRVFGLVRTAERFINAHPTHAQHKGVMLKLIDGLLATSRNQQLVAVARQFVERYPNDGQTERVQRALARVLRRDNKRREAAVVYESLWSRLGAKARDAGVEAIALYAELNNKQGYESAARVAADMLKKLPKGAFLDEVAWQGFHHFRRSGDYAGANKMGSAMFAKGLPLDKPRQALLHSYISENQWNQGQRANAAASIAKARSIEDNPSRLKAHLDYLSGAQAKPAQIKPVADEYAKQNPDDAGYASIILAYAHHNHEDDDTAIKLLAQALPNDAYSHHAAVRLIEWSGKDEKKLAAAERILLDALQKNAKPAHKNRIRYALALPLYRDRLKDTGKARAMCRDLITKSPGNDNYTWYCISHLLYSAPDDAAFTKDVQALMQSQFEHYDLSNFRQWLYSWTREARRNKQHRDRAAIAQNLSKQFWDDPFRKAVAQAFTTRGSGITQARARLLEGANYKKLTDRLARHVLGGQSYYYRHYAGSKQRHTAVSLYQRLAQRFPKELEFASRWAESAYHYGKDVDAKSAVAHLISLPPTREGGAWNTAMAGAVKAKDNALAKRAFAWVLAGQKLGKFNAYQAHDIGEYAFNAGLEKEAMAYWRQAIDASPNDHYGYYSAERLVKRLEGAARLSTIKQLAEMDSNYHGAYAAWLANDAFQAGDLDTLERVLRDSKKRQAERPFQGWGMGDYPAQYWIDGVRRSDSKLTTAQKARVLTVVRDMGIWRASATAQAALLLLPDNPQPLRGMDRLLAYRSTVDRVGTGSHDWDRLYPYAQGALVAKDYTGAATLATALLNNVTQVDGKRKDAARAMVGQAYARMGGVGLTIDENSPVAPLLKAALYLRLGDRKLALDAYDRNRNLFDEHRDTLPVDLVLFAAETHIAAGGEENHNRAEDILRGWMLKNSEKQTIENEVKARVQLLLARNYYKAGRYEVARSEFTSVKNRYPKTRQAVEAEFGIGESYMAQKIYDKAEQVFETLANSRERDVVIRAEFLRGVLANRRGDRDEARDIFRSVLERVPDITLANQTLYQLAEVYGLEQRYMDQLELLRTVGRLGRNSKRWHAPGTPLSIVVQDSDLGISRGHSKIPVRVVTKPGNDAETIYLQSGGAGKGLFRADIDTRLGSVTKDDGVLQITGNDVITVDYPDEFKQQFRSVPLADAEIRIAADAVFDVQSSKIVDVEAETFSQRLEREQAMADEPKEQRQSQKRPPNQIKPGNVVYMRVKDADRDLSDDPDEVIVKLTASSGDQVQVTMKETGPHTGVFESTANTGELPAGALASDHAIDHSPLMSIDRDRATFWASEPDGATPKSLTVDMKDLKHVGRVSVWTPDPANQSPVRGRLLGSHDGRFWYTLASNPERPPAADVQVEPGKTGTVTQQVYDLGRSTPIFKEGYAGWQQVVEMTKGRKPTGEWDGPVEAMKWALPSDHENASSNRYYAVIWRGKFVQPRDGAVRINIGGAFAAVAVDGQIEMPVTKSGGAVDIWMPRGLRDVTVFAVTTNATQGVTATRARENPNSAQVTLAAFRASDFDQDVPEAKVDGAAEKSAKPQAAAVEAAVVLGLDDVKLEKKSGEFKVAEQDGQKMIGYWRDGDVASWQFDAPKPGVYDIWIDQSNDSGGNTYDVKIGEQTVKAVVESTGDWRKFKQVRVGTVRVSKAGKLSLSITPTQIKNGGLMDLRSVALRPATGSVIATADGMWAFRFKPHKLRYVRMVVDEYIGEAVAINHVEVAGPDTPDTPGSVYIPTSADVLALANNDVLEIAAGDTVTAAYTDEFTAFGAQRNRLLTKELLATYFDGGVSPIGFNFSRSGSGAVSQQRKELMRVDPGERITIEVVDYDMDTSDQRDTVQVEVVVNDGPPLTLTATETDAYTGVFRTEVDTQKPQADQPDSAAAKKAEGDDQPAEGQVPQIKVMPGDRVFLRYSDQQNTFPGHTVKREAVVYGNVPTEGRVRIVETRYIRPTLPADSAAATNNRAVRGQAVYMAPRDVEVAGVAYEMPMTVEVIDPDMAKDSLSSVVVAVKTTDGATVNVRCVVSSQFASRTDIPADVRNWALLEGRFVGQVNMRLGSAKSASIVPRTEELLGNLVGGPVFTEEELETNDPRVVARVLHLTGKDRVDGTYTDQRNPSGQAISHNHKARLIADGQLRVVDRDYEEDITYVHVGEKLYLIVTDPDLDTTDERDKAAVRITTERGEDETIDLEETLSHSGVFTGSIDLKPREKPTPGNSPKAAGQSPEVECFFGDALVVTYIDKIASTETGELTLTRTVPVAIGTNGLVAAFSKVFGNEKLAVETQFHIAESYYELFKSHNKLGRDDESKTDLEAGRRVLREVMEDYPDPKYAPRVAYLLGQFAQELQQWDEAIEAYRTIVRQYADHTLAADAQYKLAQCYEEAGEFEEALEAYVTLAATYPKSPLIANVMVRINEHFFKKEKNYAVAAQVALKFLEKFENHEWAVRMAFRVGQSFYKDEQFVKAAEAFDLVVKRFPDDALASEALFWSGESYRMANNVPLAFRRYNRCRWDFPASDAAKYARGRLALPEMLAQFEREANLEE